MSLRIGVVAPSSRVAQVELKLGAAKLREAGFDVRVHPQCRRQHLFFAGTDEERARALFDFGHDDSLDAIWCARGGSGAVRLLPLLDRLTRERGKPPRKLFVGYSDATLLHEYVRKRWGWATLHGPVVGLREFSLLDPVEWEAAASWVRGERPAQPAWKASDVKFSAIRGAPRSVEAPLVGGNLTIWASLMGTPYAPEAQGKILFFEDVGEYLYRLDRTVHQILLAGGFEGARAIVLGNFLGCRDMVPPSLKGAPEGRERGRVLRDPKPSELKPLRPKLDEARLIPAIFEEVAAELRIPVARGLPIGHGPGHAPLPLGATYRLDPKVGLELTRWDWLGSH